MIPVLAVGTAIITFVCCALAGIPDALLPAVALGAGVGAGLEWLRDEAGR